MLADQCDQQAFLFLFDNDYCFRFPAINMNPAMAAGLMTTINTIVIV